MSAQRDNLLKRCDCEASRWPKCPHPWHLALQHDGRRYSVSLDKYAKRRGLPCPRGRGDADTLAARLTTEIQTGTYQEKPGPAAAPTVGLSNPEGKQEASPAVTFDQAWPKFVKAEMSTLTSRNSEESRFRRLADAVIDAGRVGDLPLTAITGTDIEECFVEASEDQAESSKKKLRSKLRRSFAWFVRKGHLAVNPITAATVMRVGKGARRTRRLLAGEEADLLQAARETRSDAAWRLEAVIIAALDLCLRLGELLALQWQDVRWDERRIEVRAVEVGAKKTGLGRSVPMTPRLFLQLRTLAGSNPTGQPWPLTAYVFGDAVGGRVRNIRKAWVTCVLRAHNVQPAWTGTALAADARAAFKDLNLHFHDLRHEGAQRWRTKGYALGTIQRLLGHTDVATTAIYLGVEGEEALREAETINAAEWAAAGPACSKPAAKPGAGRALAFRPKEGARRKVAV